MHYIVQCRTPHKQTHTCDAYKFIFFHFTFGVDHKIYIYIHLSLAHTHVAKTTHPLSFSLMQSTVRIHSSPYCLHILAIHVVRLRIQKCVRWHVERNTSKRWVRSMAHTHKHAHRKCNQRCNMCIAWIVHVAITYYFCRCISTKYIYHTKLAKPFATTLYVATSTRLGYLCTVSHGVDMNYNTCSGFSV